MPYADQNLLPRVVNPLPALQGNQLATPFQKGRMLELRAKGTVAGMSAASQTAIQTAFQSIVRNTENNQIAMLAETNARKAEMFDQAAQALRLDPVAARHRATAVIVLFRRHINAEAELIKAKDDSVFERLPQEYASAVRSLFYGSGPELREKLWLYIELFVELTSE
eukprot:tig00021589_g22756.t3